MKQKVLVTGASRGLGRALAELLAKEGYDVTGTYRNHAPGKSALPYRMIELELRDEKSIRDCARLVKDTDILINNAALSQLGASEEIPMDKWHDIFDVNFFGPLCLTNALLPFMREKGRGRIINIGSLSDRMPIPFQSSYAATKFALRGYTLSLWNEVKSLGIAVSLIELYGIKTEDILNRPVYFRNGSPYEGRLKKYLEFRKKQFESHYKPEQVAKSILSIIRNNNPRPVYVPGRAGKLVSLLPRLLPDKALLKLIARTVGS